MQDSADEEDDYATKADSEPYSDFDAEYQSDAPSTEHHAISTGEVEISKPLADVEPSKRLAGVEDSKQPANVEPSKPLAHIKAIKQIVHDDTINTEVSSNNSDQISSLHNALQVASEEINRDESSCSPDEPSHNISEVESSEPSDADAINPDFTATPNKACAFRPPAVATLMDTTVRFHLSKSK